MRVDTTRLICRTDADGVCSLAKTMALDLTNVAHLPSDTAILDLAPVMGTVRVTTLRSAAGNIEQARVLH